jgi:hypothetical protein
MELVELANGTFTKRELERLIVYRAAVAAGFYTDQDGSADTADTAETADTKVGSAEASATPEPPAR